MADIGRGIGSFLTNFASRIQAPRGNGFDSNKLFQILSQQQIAEASNKARIEEAQIQAGVATKAAQEKAFLAAVTENVIPFLASGDYEKAKVNLELTKALIKDQENAVPQIDALIKAKMKAIEAEKLAKKQKKDAHDKKVKDFVDKLKSATGIGVRDPLERQAKNKKFHDDYVKEQIAYKEIIDAVKPVDDTDLTNKIISPF